jgi:hypothetical protein
MLADIIHRSFEEFATPLVYDFQEKNFSLKKKEKKELAACNETSCFAKVGDLFTASLANYLS